MIYALLPFLYIWVFYILFVFVMGVYRAHLSGRLTLLHYILFGPVVVLGFAWDAVAQFTLASLIFLDPPHEILVTSRLQRYMTYPTYTWRYRLACWICDKNLDPFDPTGEHC